MRILQNKTTERKPFPPTLDELILQYIEDCRKLQIKKLDIRNIFLVFGIVYSPEYIKKTLIELAESGKIHLKVGGLHDA